MPAHTHPLFRFFALFFFLASFCSQNHTAVLALSARSLGLSESMSSIKPRILVESEIRATGPGKVPEGVSMAPFSFRLPSKGLFESYHGVFINVSYHISCACDRGVLKSSLKSRSIEFIVEVPDSAKGDETPPEPFMITPEGLENVNASSISNIPSFKITGRLFKKVCPVNLPFAGEVAILSSEAAIKSIELLLLRVETVKHPDSGKTAREATEIQTIQIADGDVCRNFVVPMYLIFPRLFTCPTMITETYRVEFEVSLVIYFVDGYMVTETFPVELYRQQ